MIIVDCLQGEKRWQQIRLGIPTASQFSRIIQPVKLLPSSGKAMKAYVAELLAEWLIGEPADGADTPWMTRGREMEEAAVKSYELANDCDTEEIGFVLTDNGLMGCSPDRFVGDNGGVEIKCPSAKVHVGYLLGDIAAEHRCQVQGCLWITGREWWDVLSYCSPIPEARVRVHRDEEFIAALEPAMQTFLELLEQGKEQLRALGAVPDADLIKLRTELLKKAA